MKNEDKWIKIEETKDKLLKRLESLVEKAYDSGFDNGYETKRIDDEEDNDDEES